MRIDITADAIRRIEIDADLVVGFEPVDCCESWLSSDNPTVVRGNQMFLVRQPPQNVMLIIPVCISVDAEQEVPTFVAQCEYTENIKCGTGDAFCAVLL